MVRLNVRSAIINYQLHKNGTISRKMLNDALQLINDTLIVTHMMMMMMVMIYSK